MESRDFARKDALISWVNKSDIIEQRSGTGQNPDSDITDVVVDNNYTASDDITRILINIDWIHSLLSRQYIEDNQLSESVEMIVGGLAEGSFQDGDEDVQAINHYLMRLAYLFTGAVKNGAQLAAVSARAGMMNALSIRNELTMAKKAFPDTFDKYLKSCCKYLDCYVLYTNVSAQVDAIQDIVNDYKDALDKKEKQYQQTLKNIEKYIRSDTDLKKELVTFKDQTFNQSSGVWSRELHELYQELVSLRIQQFNMKYESFLLDSEEKKFHETSAVREQLRTTLNGSRPTPETDIMDSMEDIYRDILDKSRKSEMEFSKLLSKMDEVSKEIDQIQGKKFKNIK